MHRCVISAAQKKTYPKKRRNYILSARSDTHLHESMLPSAKNSMRRCNLLASSSQQAEHVQLVACGVNTPSSMSACRLRPPYRIDLFQSWNWIFGIFFRKIDILLISTLLDPRPHRFSNSLGVYQLSLCLILLPRPPEPSRTLNSSAVVVLHRIGRMSMFIGCSAQLPLELDEWWLLFPLFWWFWLLTCCSTCCNCCCTSAAICSAVLCCWMTMVLMPSPEFVSPEFRTLLERKPLLSRHSIGFIMCCIWSLDIIGPTGTLTNFLKQEILSSHMDVVKMQNSPLVSAIFGTCDNSRCQCWILQWCQIS